MAMALSENGNPSLQNWIYEPDFLRLDDYVPDFACQVPTLDRRSFWWVVIEYKPRLVTDTYLDELAERFEDLQMKHEHIGKCVLLCFDYFQGMADMFYEWTSGVMVENGGLNDRGWMGPSTLKKIQSHRFDLAGG